MENNAETVKKNNKNLIIIIGIAVVVLVAVVLAIVLGSGKNSSSNTGNENKTTTKPAGVIIDLSHVVDGDYKADIKGDKYTDFFKKEHKFDIVVPKIKIDSAESVNVEIEKLYRKFVNTYNECYNLSKNINIESGNKLACSIKVDYTSSVVGNIISILITKEYSDDLAVYNPEYYTFNFDTETGTLLTYSDLLAKHNYSKEAVAEKIMTAYNEFVKTAGDVTVTEEDRNKTLEAANGDNIAYVTTDGKIGIIYNCYISALSSKPLLPVMTLE